MAHAVADLERGRDSYSRHAWLNAYESLSAADTAAELGAEDLERLARSAYMVGRDDDYVGGLDRAHRAHLQAGDKRRAALCTLWIGHNMLFRGDTVRAQGWFARAERLLARERDCVERGWLLIPVWLRQMAAGDWQAGEASAAQAAAIGERFGDADLVWLARDEQARALLNLERADEALRLLDEALVAAAAGELSPFITGIVYCNTIAFCRDAYRLRHARAWTEALTDWCANQPEMVAHNGLCLVHRAEIMQLQGAWEDALVEARQASERFTDGVLNRLACAEALYRQGELHRLRGDLRAAERSYREASRCGREPQPGLALVRLAQGRLPAAVAGIRRAVGETVKPLKRAALLPAYVQIMLAAGEVEVATSACRQLEEIAQRHGGDALHAMSAHASASVALAMGDAGAALLAARRAVEHWRDLAAPYESARSRALVGMACRALGDEDAAALELEAAREMFERLGAASDLASLEASSAPRRGALGLTAREIEVLRLVAAGCSNREIASALVISDRTVARHLQNIFAKLRVSSRTAAAAFAFEQELV